MEPQYHSLLSEDDREQGSTEEISVCKCMCFSDQTKVDYLDCVYN